MDLLGAQLGPRHGVQARHQANSPLELVTGISNCLVERNQSKIFQPNVNPNYLQNIETSIGSFFASFNIFFFSCLCLIRLLVLLALLFLFLVFCFLLFGLFFLFAKGCKVRRVSCVDYIRKTKWPTFFAGLDSFSSSLLFLDFFFDFLGLSSDDDSDDDESDESKQENKRSIDSSASSSSVSSTNVKNCISSW